MPKSVILNTSLAIATLALMVALPNIETIFIDFTELGNGAITLMRIALIGVAFYFLGESL